MAMDTADERAAALGMFLWALARLPLPDSTMEEEDRPQILGYYNGIGADEPVAPTSQGSFILILMR